MTTTPTHVSSPVTDSELRVDISRRGAQVLGATPRSMLSQPMMAGLHHACLPVSNIERAVDWFADALGFDPCVTFEDEDRVTGVLLEHPCGAAVLLRADPGRAVALAGFPALAFAVPDADALQTWCDHLSALGVSHSEVTAAHPGWTVRLWGPDMVEMSLTTAAPLDGAADESDHME